MPKMVPLIDSDGKWHSEGYEGVAEKCLRDDNAMLDYVEAEFRRRDIPMIVRSLRNKKKD